MARDYDAELARAMEKVERIKKAKAEALRRKREPIGKVMLELFPDLEKCSTEKEIRAFITHVGEKTHGFNREDDSPSLYF